MKNYGKTYSATRPNTLTITPFKVYVAANIEEYSQEDEHGVLNQGYQYDFIEYTKDEYILLMAEELEATKILLGVE